MPRSQRPEVEQPSLAPERAIQRLEQRIVELEKLDCSNVSSYDAPEISALRTSILITLEQAFGKNSSAYNQFKGAAYILQTRVLNMSGGSGRDGARGPDNRQIQEDCAKSKNRNVALLRSAVQILEESLEGVAHKRKPEVRAAAERSTVVIHKSGTLTGNVGVGNSSGAISSAVDIKVLKDCISELRRYESEHSKLPGTSNLPIQLSEAESELAKQSPNIGRVRISKRHPQCA